MKSEFKSKIKENILKRFTQEQKNAVASDGGTLLLSASAGSGKTSVLTARVLRRIACENPINADRLLIVTFSKLAAEEMRQRISAGISSLIKEFPENENLIRQQTLIYKAQISTISAFCIRVVKENFSLAGVTPDFRIAEDAELAVLSGMAVSEVLEKYYERGDESFIELTEYFYVKDDRGLIDIIYKLHEFLMSYPFPFEWLDEKLKIYTGELKTDGLTEFLISHVKSNLENIKKLNQKGIELLAKNPKIEAAYIDSFIADRNEIDLLLELCEKADWDELYHEFERFSFPRIGTLRGFVDDEIKETAMALRKSLQDRFGKLADIISCSLSIINKEISLQMPVISCLFSIVKEYDLKLEKLKRERNILSFSDAEHLAVRLLVEPANNSENISYEKYEKTKLCRELIQNFDEIMIDEFQDTNKTQDLIFEALSNRGNNIFMVGDVKQSIYAFRKAMPEIFIKKRNAFNKYDGENYPAVILLTKNFRSRKEVTSSVNFIMRRIMSVELGGTDYDEKEELIAGAEFPKVENQSFDTEIHLINMEMPDSTDTDDSKVALEARHIALQIREMINQGFKVTDKNGMRPCRYSDFAILLRATKSKADIYVKELLNQGVNAWGDKSTGYFSSREIVLMMNLLRIIDNPLLDIPFVSVLLSPIGNFSADEVSIIRLVDKRIPVYLCMTKLMKEKCGSAEGERAQIQTKVRDFIETLNKLRIECNILPIDKFIRKVYDDTSFLSITGAMEAGGSKQANLRLLINYAAKYEAAGFRGVSGFLRFTDKATEGKSDFESANTYTGDNSVRVMSIHKSKGLEFPVCFVADCSKGFNFKGINGDVLINSDFGFTMKIKNREKLRKYETVPFWAAKIKEKQAILSEEMRILYVAMTRAKEKLIFTMNGKNLKSLAAGIYGASSEKEKLHPGDLTELNSYMKWILTAVSDNPHCRRMMTESGILSINKSDNNSFEISDNSDANINFKIFPPLLKQDLDKALNNSEEQMFLHKADSELIKKIELNISYKYPFMEASKTPAKLAAASAALKISAETANINKNNNKSDSKTNSSKIYLKRPDFMKKQGFTPAEKGIILHEFMQIVDFKAAKKDLKAHMKYLVANEFLTEEEAATIDLKSVANFFNSDLMKRIEKSEILREFKFMDEISEGQPDNNINNNINDKILVQGIADLVIIEDDGFSVIDYKTDKADENYIVNTHRPQLEFYGRALSKIFEMPLKDLIIYSLNLSKTIIIN